MRSIVFLGNFFKNKLVRMGSILYNLSMKIQHIYINNHNFVTKHARYLWIREF